MVSRRVQYSDRGVQHASLSFGKPLEDEGLVPSMSRVSSAHDNALAKIFIAALNTELLYRDNWFTWQAVRTAVFEYMEDLYNTRRRHTLLWVISVRASTKRLN